MVLQREVETRVIFLRIGDIDTVNERFFAEILIESKWEESKLVSEFDKSKLLNDEKEIPEKNKYWNPKIYVENTLNDPKLTVNYKAKKIIDANSKDSNEQNTKFWIYEYKKIKGFFFQKLKLKYFPLDVQDLSIILTTYKSSDQVLLVQNKEKSSIIGSSMTIDKNIWHLYQHVEVSSNSDVISNQNIENERIIESMKSLINFPMLMFQCRVSRRAGYYFWNAYFLIFLITASIFAIFSVRPDQPHFRLPTTATLLLTSITFRWSYSSRCLPTVNYLTSLDVYSIKSIGLVFLCFIWHGLVTILFNFFDYNTVNIIDKSVFGFLFLFFILVNLTLLIWLKFALNIRHSMTVNDQIFFNNQNKTNDQVMLDLLEVYNYDHFNNDLTFSSAYNTIKSNDLINSNRHNKGLMEQLSQIYFKQNMCNINENNEKF